MPHKTLPTQQATLINRYLSHYGEPEAALFDKLSPSHKHHCIDTRCLETTYRYCLVIPAYNETSDFAHRLVHHPSSQQHPILLIVVINQPDTDANTDKNQHLWNELIEHYGNPINRESDIHPQFTTPTLTAPDYYWLHGSQSQVDILLINRFSENKKIPKQQGVGLARKIGADIACQLIAQHRIMCEWIHHTDADVHLPEQYFSIIPAILSSSTATPANSKNTLRYHIPYSAILYPYQHIQPDSMAADQQQNTALLAATQRYEQALHYYVEGLRYAQSPYAYHSLGSCIVTHVILYCQVRGFPKKPAGEDFYLLNKLAKLAPVLQLEAPTITIDARLSDRVPFGTGPAVTKIIAMENADEEYKYYHPHCFEELRVLLKHFSCLFHYCKNNTPPTNQQNIEKQKEHNRILPLSQTTYLPWLAELSIELQQALQDLSIDKLLVHLDKQVHSEEQCLYHCHQWLDAFRTLKLIHHLSEYYPHQALTITLKANGLGRSIRSTH